MATKKRKIIFLWVVSTGKFSCPSPWPQTHAHTDSSNWTPWVTESEEMTSCGREKGMRGKDWADATKILCISIQNLKNKIKVKGHLIHFNFCFQIALLVYSNSWVLS